MAESAAPDAPVRRISSSPRVQLGRRCSVSSCTLVQSATVLVILGSLAFLFSPNSISGTLLVVALLVAALHVALIVRAKQQQSREQQAAKFEEEMHLKENLEQTFPAKEMVCTADAEGDLEQGDKDVCIICMEDFATGDRYRELACHHIFHEKCIDDWWVHQCHRVTEMLQCPTCRRAACDVHGIGFVSPSELRSSSKEAIEGPMMRETGSINSARSMREARSATSVRSLREASLVNPPHVVML